MVKSKRFRSAVVAGLLVLFGAAALGAGGSAGDELLKMMPAESLFCVQVNNFDYTLSQIDQFLAGVLPIPMGASMMVRAQFARVLGSPTLNGVNMGGSFAIFGTVLPGASTEDDSFSNMFIGIFAPVTDYKQFVSGNPNCSQPDAKGVSQIAIEEVPALLSAQVGNYALISWLNSYDNLIAVVQSISSGRSTQLASALDIAEAQVAGKEPLWAYVNVQRASKAFGPMASMQLEQAKMMMEAAKSEGEGEMVPPIMDMDFEKQLEEIQFLSLTVSPKPNACNLRVSVAAMPGTEMAKALVADDPKILEMMNIFKARNPRQMGSEMGAISGLIPEADKANFVGTYNLLNLFNLAAGMVPIPLPEVDVPAKSNIAFAIKIGGGKMAADIALPKEHLAEIMVAVQAMQEEMAEGLVTMEPDISEGIGEEVEVKIDSVDIPQQAVQGRISGTDVVLENASFDGNLSIYTGDSWGFNPSLLIFLFLDEDTIPAGQTFTARPTAGFQANEPHIHYRWKDPATGDIETAVVMSKYRLDLKFDQVVGGMLPGQILFEVPGKDTRVEGRFNAKIEGIDMTKVRTKETVTSRPSFDSTVSQPPVVTPAGSGLTNVKVAGVRLVRFSDFEQGIMPLGQGKGYTLSLMAELPATVVKVSGGRVEKATTDTGKSLVPKELWDRKIRLPRLSNDKKTVVFDIELLVPEEDAEGLNEVSGALEYLTAGSSRQVDLGTMALKAGTKGRDLGAVVRSVGKDPWRDDATLLSLNLNLLPEAVSSVEFFAPDGTKLDAYKSGHVSLGGLTTFKYTIKGKLPPRGRIVLNVLEDLQKNEIPFKITEISLTGQSLW